MEALEYFSSLHDDESTVRKLAGDFFFLKSDAMSGLGRAFSYCEQQVL
jgi:hypothetical protein